MEMQESYFEDDEDEAYEYEDYPETEADIFLILVGLSPYNREY